MFFTKNEIDSFISTTTRIANALEKIAEKDFGGNKSIHEHRIHGFRVIENVKELVNSFIRYVNERIAKYERSGLDTIDIKEWKEELQLILDELKK